MIGREQTLILNDVDKQDDTRIGPSHGSRLPVPWERRRMVSRWISPKAILDLRHLGEVITESQ